jgi:alpha/beta superfamily hydrolase
VVLVVGIACWDLGYAGIETIFVPFSFGSAIAMGAAVREMQVMSVAPSIEAAAATVDVWRK